MNRKQTTDEKLNFVVNCFLFALKDIDECAMNTHTCDTMATCMNTMGSYECMCDMGYEGDGFMCTGTSCFSSLIFTNIERC